MESFQNFATIFKLSAKIVISILTKMKILVSIEYVISQLNILRGRKIAQGG